METKNKFYVLKSNLDAKLSTYSYNVSTGESQVVADTYGFPTSFSIVGNRANNVNYKPVFVLAPDILYYNIDVLCYDNSGNLLGHKSDTYRYTGGRKILELLAGTTEIKVNFNTPAKDYSQEDARIWFYVGYEVISHHKKLELQNKKENGQMFFRESLNGTSKLFGDDYNFVESAYLEQNLIFIVCDKEGNYIAKNNFNKTDCKFDRCKHSVQLKLSPEDKYSQILDKYDNTYDIIKLAPAITRLTLTKRMAYQIYIAGANNITTVANGTYWEDDVNEVIDDYELLKNKYYFAKVGDSKYEIHLEGFNYDINTTFLVDKNSSVWNATSQVHVWIDGQETVYTMPASIKFTKIRNAGTAQQEGDPWAYMLIDGTSDGLINVGTDESPSYVYAGDAYRIEIYTGLNGTGTKIYQSYHLFCTNNTNGFLMSPGEDTYIMVRIEQPIPMKNPEPERFSLGNNIIEYAICARVISDIDEVIVGGETYRLYDIPNDDFTFTRANYKKCIGIIGLTLHQVAATSEKPTKYGMDDYGRYFTSNFLGSMSFLYGRPIPVSRSAWANTSIWVTFGDSWVTDFEAKFRKQFTLKDAYALEDVISAMLAKIDPNITHEGTSDYSQFLYSGTSPISWDTARNGYKIYIAPKSNILKGNYDQAAQKAELTFEQLMKMLRDCFKCYWFIDDQNRFRIEHVTYFLKGMSYTNPVVQFDLTQKFDKFNKKQALYCQQNTEFEKTELTSRYEFAWMDDCTDLFGNNSIDVISKYIQKDKTEDVNADTFSSDIDLMLYCPDKFNPDGFALLVARASDGKVPIVSSSAFKDDEYIGPMGDGSYSATPQNYLASWLYLMRYYTFDMPANNIEYDGLILTDAMRVKGIKKCMKHDIEFPSSQLSININQLIKTEIGNGYIEEVSTNLDTNMTKIELRYEPE